MRPALEYLLTLVFQSYSQSGPILHSHVTLPFPTIFYLETESRLAEYKYEYLSQARSCIVSSTPSSSQLSSLSFFSFNMPQVFEYTWDTPAYKGKTSFSTGLYIGGKSVDSVDGETWE